MGYYLLDNPNPNAAQYAYPRRGGRKPSGTIIVHTAEGNGRAGVARFIANRSDYGSYHRLSDETGTTKMLPFEYEAWQDSETNGWGIGISAACYSADWKRMPAARADAILRNLAKAAAEAVEYMRATHGVNIPIRRISGAQARAGVPGFAAHGDSGISRSDPGRDFDWDLFFTYINQELGGIYAATVKPITLDPLEEIMAMYKDRAEFEARMAKLIIANGPGYENEALSKDDMYAMARLGPERAAYLAIREPMTVTDWSTGEKVKAQQAAFLGTTWNQVHRRMPAYFKEVIANQAKLLAMVEALAQGSNIDMAAVEAAAAEGARKGIEEWEQISAEEIANAVVDEQAERLIGGKSEATEEAK